MAFQVPVGHVWAKFADKLSFDPRRDCRDYPFVLGDVPNFAVDPLNILEYQSRRSELGLLA